VFPGDPGAIEAVGVIAHRASQDLQVGARADAAAAAARAAADSQADTFAAARAASAAVYRAAEQLAMAKKRPRR